MVKAENSVELDIDEQNMSVAKQLELLNVRLQCAHNKEKQYRKAILQDAVTFFEINLTKDVFLTEASQVVDGKIVNLFEYLGIKPFERYSEYVQFWAGNTELAELDAYRKFFDIDRLIQCYGKGEVEQNFESWITDIRGRRRLVRYILLMEKNEYTDDIHVLSVTKDLTEQTEGQCLLRSALRQAKAAGLAREVFLSNISHDMRTPLNAIIGYTELARQHKTEADKIEDYMEKIQTSSEQLLSIVTAALEITRMEFGRVSLSKKPFHIGELLTEVEKMVEMEMKMKFIRFEVDKSSIHHFAIVADFMRLKQVLCQLLDNAAKYTQPGGRVTLRVEERDIQVKGYRQYRFIVEDNGIGISEEFKERLFEPFARENNTTESGILGTGLGLVVVKNIVDMMEGRIEVESSSGEGSRFTVEVLFRLQKEQSSNETVEEKTDKEPLEPAEIRILLAEDNEINREIVQELLMDSGFMVEVAENGEAAYEKLKRSAPGFYSLILMDIQMPVMNGYEAARAIRRMSDKELAEIPIIALSANAFAEDQQKSIDAGMNAHVTKPIDVGNLFEVMDRTLAERKNVENAYTNN